MENKGRKTMKTKAYKEARAKLQDAREELEAIWQEHHLDDSFTTTDPVKGLMVGHAQNFTNPNTPGSLSPEIVKTRLRERLGFKGIAWTDDMRMGVIDFYVTNGDGKPREKGPGERYTRALAVGITIPMLLHSTGSLDEMVERVRKAIKDRKDFDEDGKPDITMESIDARVRQVLDQKVELGLLSKKVGTRTVECTGAALRESPKQRCSAPVTIYKNTARQYMAGTRAYRNQTARGK